jgi:hypothetical protein
MLQKKRARLSQRTGSKATKKPFGGLMEAIYKVSLHED